MDTQWGGNWIASSELGAVVNRGDCVKWAGWRAAVCPMNLVMPIVPSVKTRLKQRIRRWLARLLQRLLQPFVQAIVAPMLAEWADRQQQDLDHRLQVDQLSPIVQTIINTEIRIWGERDRLHLAPTSAMVNTLFNLSSGQITVGDHTFTGHNVSIITGTHDYHAVLADRLTDVPESGRDITIGQGVWIGSNAIILGPCTIGDHAVIAAGAVVTAGSQIAAGAIVAGIPAKVIKQIDGL
jgi:acetyltransferase-like isoleucine patch superfamily enzyme